MGCDILLVEDDDEIAQLTKMYLEASGYRVSVIDDGAKALSEIQRTQPELVILDLMLPSKSGVDICREARQTYQGMIIVLTASEDEMCEVSLLKLGADDYLTKPVRGNILIARIEALMRRYQAQKLSYPVTKSTGAYGLTVDDENQTVYYQDNPINLTQSEFEILQLLIENSGQTVTREHCCQVARGIEYCSTNRSIDMRVSTLRKKLNQAEVLSVSIRTVRNQGYRLVGGQP